MAGQSGQSKLIRDLAGMDWWGRRRAIESLRTYPEESYIPLLVENIRDHADANARNASMEVLVALGHKALPVLAVLIEDADPEVRLFAVNMLCAMREAETVPLLVRAYSDTDDNVRSACVEALGKLGGDSALRVCRDALADNPWVALTAVHSLGEMGGQGALELLYDCLRRPDLQQPAIRALEKAGTRDSLGHLSRCVNNPGLGPDLLRTIVAIVEREGSRPNPEYFLSLRPIIGDMLNSADAGDRKNAFIALCWAQDSGSINTMLDGIRDEEMQEYAIDGLLSIGRRGLCSITDEMKGSEGQHRVILAKLLSMMGEPMALLQFAEDPDPEVRTEVALALGCLQELQRARDILKRMLSDPHEEVREAAQVALRTGEAGMQ